MTVEWILYPGGIYPEHVATIDRHSVSIKDCTLDGGTFRLVLDGLKVDSFPTLELAQRAAGDWPEPEQPVVADVIKIRIGRPTLGFLEGTGVWQNVEYPGDRTDEQLAAEAGSMADVTLARKIQAANVRKDGSVTVTLEPGEAWGLHLMASAMVEGASDNCYPGETEALAELNSGGAVMRNLEAVGVRS